MNLSFTGFSYLLGFFAIGLLTYRFFQYWRREKSTLSKLFLYVTLLFTLFMLITAIGGFFGKNVQILKGVVISATFLQALSCALIAIQ